MLVDADALESMFVAAGNEDHKTIFLVNRFKNGFSIGYQGRRNIRKTAPNLKFRGVGDKLELWNKVMKEVGLNRYARPFDIIPFDYYVQSSIGLVPKDGGWATHLIFHLSYPRTDNTSVNANTPKSITSVTNPDFDQAVKLCRRLGIGCKMGKSDMTSASRNLGIKASDWWLLIMKAEHLVMGNIWYFVEKCLPFGASRSFQMQWHFW